MNYGPGGAPIWVLAHWTGEEIVLLFHDGSQTLNRTAEPLQTCPRCHHALVPDELTWLPGFSHRNILIVEDDDELRLLLADLLAKAGF